jgi:hypothetical protein
VGGWIAQTRRPHMTTFMALCLFTRTGLKYAARYFLKSQGSNGRRRLPATGMTHRKHLKENERTNYRGE